MCRGCVCQHHLFGLSQAAGRAGMDLALAQPGAGPITDPEGVALPLFDNSAMASVVI